MEQYRGTTIVAVKKDGKVALAGDGQVTAGNTILKGNARKVRQLYDGQVVTGFAGGTADAFTLFEHFEQKLKKYSGDLVRSAVEMAKLWRADQQLRQLDAQMIVANNDKILLLTGVGDVVEPEYNVMAIGSGGNFALSAALAYIDAKVDMDAREIAYRSVKIASSLCIYTDDKILVEVPGEPETFMDATKKN
ncbi:MAG: ATP-dependent protease subunit HslV [Spirochaetia bacterium]|jgi:ATP-dependent HslUV protease subunit HslV|nr:ATP-dependent protease subunit HslV [Spirochaetia bacterium]